MRHRPDDNKLPGVFSFSMWALRHSWHTFQTSLLHARSRHTRAQCGATAYDRGSTARHSCCAAVALSRQPAAAAMKCLVPVLPGRATGEPCSCPRRFWVVCVSLLTPPTPPLLPVRRACCRQPNCWACEARRNGTSGCVGAGTFFVGGGASGTHTSARMPGQKKGAVCLLVAG